MKPKASIDEEVGRQLQTRRDELVAEVSGFEGAIAAARTHHERMVKIGDAMNLASAGLVGRGRPDLAIYSSSVPLNAMAVDVPRFANPKQRRVDELLQHLGNGEAFKAEPGWRKAFFPNAPGNTARAGAW